MTSPRRSVRTTRICRIWLSNRDLTSGSEKIYPHTQEKASTPGAIRTREGRTLSVAQKPERFQPDLLFLKGLYELLMGNQ